MNWIPCFLFILTPFFPLSALEQLDGDLSLKADPQPKPEVFGVTFGKDIQVVSEQMRNLGLILKEQRSTDNEGLTRVLTFSGTPRGIPASNGRSELLFFKGKLIRMDFLFPPSYENFLLVRKQLFYSMGNRFQLDYKKEVMDDLLRSTLVNMKGEEGAMKSNDLVGESLIAGSTFFFYKLQDQKQELNVTYSYYSPKNSQGIPVAELRLHYSLADALDDYKSQFRKQRRGPAKLLPTNGKPQ